MNEGRDKLGREWIWLLIVFAPSNIDTMLHRQIFREEYSPMDKTYSFGFSAQGKRRKEITPCNQMVVPNKKKTVRREIGGAIGV